ncbi:MAG: DUF4367 domain-containing protein [Chloroflexi bacterium]|nr:DUF4367 domain-containing protein [Chloroflexota bacterium]
MASRKLVAFLTLFVLTSCGQAAPVSGDSPTSASLPPTASERQANGALPEGIDPAILEDAQAQADFTIAVPRYLPPGIEIRGATVLEAPAGLPGKHSKEVILVFQSGVEGFQLTERMAYGRIVVDDASIVTIQGVMGQLHEETDQNGRLMLTIVWERNGISIEMWGFGLTRDEFFRIAESVA